MFGRAQHQHISCPGCKRETVDYKGVCRWCDEDRKPPNGLLEIHEDMRKPVPLVYVGNYGQGVVNAL